MRPKQLIRRGSLRMLRGAGAFRILRDSRWRKQRLLILCYHGVSLEDEHLWRPALYLEPLRLKERLEILKSSAYNVLSLAEGLRRLKSRTLPSRSVVLTFDDGGHDFYARAYPILKSYGFPVTVYQTTYYVEHEVPLLNLMGSYLLWKRRGDEIEVEESLGLGKTLNLRTESNREEILRRFLRVAEKFPQAKDRNVYAARLSESLAIDYQALESKRLLHLMNCDEIAQLARQGVDFQLHSHRHRAPLEEPEFRREIQQNRSQLSAITGRRAEHFCYPGGYCDFHFLPWLKAEGIISATTCDPDLADADTDPLLLPRFVDTTGRSQIEFESWLCGAGSMFG